VEFKEDGIFPIEKYMDRRTTWRYGWEISLWGTTGNSFDPDEGIKTNPQCPGPYIIVNHL
jgi:hypothetical protein